MAILNPYLTLPGNCEDAFNFYKEVFGGDFTYVGRFSEMPENIGQAVPEKDKNKIMHISLPLSAGSVLMGSDSGTDWGPKTVIGNNISLSITAKSKEEADRVFKMLTKDGKVNMPMDQTFWGDYFGMCTDQFGINWMISFNQSNPS